MKSLSLFHLLLVLLVPTAAVAATERVEQTHAFSAEGRVRLSNVNGSVEIVGWDRDEVSVVAIKSSERDDDLDYIEVLIDAQPDLLVIETRYGRTGRWFWNRRAKGNVSYTLHVPGSAKLEDISAVNSSIELVGLDGPIQASTVNGGIESRDLAGNAFLKTVNGKISVAYRSVTPRTRIQLESVNGAVDLAIPADAGANVEARAFNGRVRCELATTHASTSGRRFSGQIGEGGTEISVSTVNGGVTIRAAEFRHPG